MLNYLLLFYHRKELKMKEFIQRFLCGILPFGTFMYVLFNGYPEPLGLIVGVVCGLLGLLIAGKEISRCLH